MDFSFDAWALDHFALTMPRGGGAYYDVIEPLEAYTESETPLGREVKSKFERRFVPTVVNTERDIVREYYAMILRLGQKLEFS
jgi:hypothetical protein